MESYQNDPTETDHERRPDSREHGAGVPTGVASIINTTMAGRSCAAVDHWPACAANRCFHISVTRGDESSTLVGMSDLGRILNTPGDPVTGGHLLPLVYDELRMLAAQKLAQERPDHTLDATALVHEAYLRLAGAGSFSSKSSFYRAAAVAMRRILVDHARSRGAEKRGGQRRRVALEDGQRIAESPEHLLALDEALERLAVVEPRKAELVMLRFFGGLSMEEAAETLEVSLPTAKRWWAFARAWLYAELAEAEDQDPQIS